MTSGVPQAPKNQSGLYRCGKLVALKGHGFNRAATQRLNQEINQRDEVALAERIGM